MKVKDENNKLNATKTKALISLLDDPDRSVYDCVKAEISPKSIDKTGTYADRTGVCKADCPTTACKRITPKFRLTSCNIKTIILLALAFYFWLANN